MKQIIPNAFVVPLALYGIVSLVCTQIPLLNYLGFEFSLTIALLGSVTSAWSGIACFRQRLRQPEPGPPRALFSGVLSWNLFLLLVPLLVVSVNALFVPNCSFGEGLLFYLLLPGVSVFFSTCLSFFVTIHYDHPRSVVAALFFLSLVYVAALGYLTPSIFSYNFFYGFFPGLTYDEVLNVTPTLVLFRAVTLLAGYTLMSAGLLILEEGPVSRSTLQKGLALVRALPGTGRGTVVLGLMLALGLTYVFRNELGFEASASYVRSQLGSSVTTEHFDIYYSDSSYTREEISWLAAEHEFRLHQIAEFLHVASAGRYASYLYPTMEMKKRLVGAGRTSIAKPWSGQVHIDAGSVDQVLKHELVHLVAAPMGIPVLDASVYPGLTEGLAMAAEWSWGIHTLHEHSAAILRHAPEPDMERIMHSLGFVRNSSSLSYVLAGSFCRFLADRYGVDRLVRVYPFGQFETVYQQPLSALVQEWQAMLDSMGLDAGSMDRTEVFFSSPPMFDRICPRATAQTGSQAGRFFRVRQYGMSSALFLRAYQDGGNVADLQGYLLSELRQGNTAPSLAVIDSMHGAPGRMLTLFLTLGDALWADGKEEAAGDFYDRLVCADLSRSYTEAGLVRLLAIKSGPAAREIKQYLLSDQPDSLRGPILDSVIARFPACRPAFYLRGSWFLRRKAYDKGAADFVAAQGDSSLDPYLLLNLGDALFRLRRFEEAQEAYRQSSRVRATPGFLEEVRDRVERCAWFSRMKMPDGVRKEVASWHH